MGYIREIYCAVCGKLAQQTHHIIYRSKWKEGENNPDNMLSVCAICHDLIHRKKKRVPDIYWKKANEAYDTWLRAQNKHINGVQLDWWKKKPEKIHIPPYRPKSLEEVFRERKERREAYLAQQREREKLWRESRRSI